MQKWLIWSSKNGFLTRQSIAKFWRISSTDLDSEDDKISIFNICFNLNKFTAAKHKIIIITKNNYIFYVFPIAYPINKFQTLWVQMNSVLCLNWVFQLCTKLNWSFSWVRNNTYPYPSSILKIYRSTDLDVRIGLFDYSSW